MAEYKICECEHMDISHDEKGCRVIDYSKETKCPCKAFREKMYGEQQKIKSE